MKFSEAAFDLVSVSFVTVFQFQKLTNSYQFIGVRLAYVRRDPSAFILQHTFFMYSIHKTLSTNENHSVTEVEKARNVSVYVPQALSLSLSFSFSLSLPLTLCLSFSLSRS